MKKILFLQKDLFQQEGYMCLSAELRKRGYETKVVVSNLEKDPVAAIHEENPDFVGILCTTGQHKWALSMAKRLPFKIVLGGPHPTFCPEIVDEENIYAVLRGEADYTFPELVEGRIPLGCWTKEERRPMGPGVENLDLLEMPDRELYYHYPFFRKQVLQPVMTGRGCPHSCSFCFNAGMRRLMKGLYVRKRSPERVIEEILYMRDNSGVKRIIFEDDTFNSDNAWLLKFCEQYENIKMPFSCRLRAENVTSETTKALKNAGCFTVKMGIESGSQELRNRVLNKSLTDDQIIRASRHIKQAGLRLKTYNLLCIPGQRLEDAFRDIRLNQRIGAEFAHANVLHPYPGTAIYDAAVEKGMLSPEDLDDMNYTFFGVPPWEVDQRLYNLQKFFSLCVDMPFLAPLVRVLIRAPKNPIYEAILKQVYYYKSIKYERPGIRDAIKTAIFNRDYFK